MNSVLDQELIRRAQAAAAQQILQAAASQMPRRQMGPPPTVGMGNPILPAMQFGEQLAQGGGGMPTPALAQAAPTAEDAGWSGDPLGAIMPYLAPFLGGGGASGGTDPNPLLEKMRNLRVPMGGQMDMPAQGMPPGMPPMVPTNQPSVENAVQPSAPQMPDGGAPVMQGTPPADMAAAAQGLPPQMMAGMAGAPPMPQGVPMRPEMPLEAPMPGADNSWMAGMFPPAAPGDMSGLPPPPLPGPAAFAPPAPWMTGMFPTQDVAAQVPPRPETPVFLDAAQNPATASGPFDGRGIGEAINSPNPFYAWLSTIDRDAPLVEKSLASAEMQALSQTNPELAMMLAMGNMFGGGGGGGGMSGGPPAAAQGGDRSQREAQAWAMAAELPPESRAAAVSKMMAMYDSVATLNPGGAAMSPAMSMMAAGSGIRGLPEYFNQQSNQQSQLRAQYQKSLADLPMQWASIINATKDDLRGDRQVAVAEEGQKMTAAQKAAADMRKSVDSQIGGPNPWVAKDPELEEYLFLVNAADTTLQPAQKARRDALAPKFPSKSAWVKAMETAGGVQDPYAALQAIGSKAPDAVASMSDEELTRLLTQFMPSYKSSGAPFKPEAIQALSLGDMGGGIPSLFGYHGEDGNAMVQRLQAIAAKYGIAKGDTRSWSEATRGVVGQIGQGQIDIPYDRLPAWLQKLAEPLKGLGQY